MNITLTQFEALDAAHQSFLRDDSAKNESRLFTALIEAVGYQRAGAFPVVSEGASEIITGVMFGRIVVVDIEADDYIDDSCEHLGRDEMGQWEYVA